MAQQALAIHDLAPGRQRLGIGPGHRPIIEGSYGLPMPSPLAYLREYVGVLRDLLGKGSIEHHGTFFNITATSRTAPVPLLVSALGQKAFHLAGEISDGALSWVCPVPYLLAVTPGARFHCLNTDLSSSFATAHACRPFRNCCSRWSSSSAIWVAVMGV